MEVKVTPKFGLPEFYKPDGRSVDLFTVTNKHGNSVSMINYGAAWVSAEVPDRYGKLGNVLLGYLTMAGYLHDPNYMGVTVGRFANRIEGAQFDLDGVRFKIATKGTQHSLHGGAEGFSHRIWNSQVEDDGVTFTLVSPDGDQGFPGELHVSVRYRWNDDNCLRIEFGASTNKPTPVSLTNHAYFNLRGRQQILDQMLKINADFFLPMKGDCIVTGEKAPVEGTPFDFRTAKAIGRDINCAHEQLAMGGGYDQSFLIKDTDDGKLLTVAEASDTESGRAMLMRTTYPTVHLYTGNFLQRSNVINIERSYGRRDGFCLEAQYSPNSPNLPDFPSCILRPGGTYSHATEFQFTAI
ncbi:MAG: galactose mutarotase [Prevotellaceae bacterium]|jgi:aldose 1-epimerase|nr:galactose mutarotase [Prevotellaceae bacterium]